MATVAVGGSIVISFINGNISVTVDSSSSPIASLLLNGLLALSIFIVLAGLFLELYQQFFGEASQRNRAKSIDLCSLSGSSPPLLSAASGNTVESSGVHNDLFLTQDKGDTLSQWLRKSSISLQQFAEIDLQRLNKHEADHPLALGAIGHVPHCFVLGFLVGNKRLVHYYCWNREAKKEERSRWIDCRDKRTRGQSTDGRTHLLTAGHVSNDSDVTKLGISIEISIPSNTELFMNDQQLDACAQISVKKQYIGNVFSERGQVKIVEEIRCYLNTELFQRFENLEELHLTITAQASFVMRLGADFNQNHFPSIIKIHHFDRTSYPWKSCI